MSLRSTLLDILKTVSGHDQTLSETVSTFRAEQLRQGEILDALKDEILTEDPAVVDVVKSRTARGRFAKTL